MVYNTILFFLCYFFSFFPLKAQEYLTTHSIVCEFFEELGIRNTIPNPNTTCTIYLVHHGSTDWSECCRLQGWNNLPLNAKGRHEADRIGEILRDQAISAIYSSPLQQALETAQIIQMNCSCPLYVNAQLKGEFHGLFEGYTQEQYLNTPHFKIYDSLSPKEEIFFPCGENGESKAEMARRMVPAIKEICNENLGKKIVIVTHGGIFKLLNFFLGQYSNEGTVSIPNGAMIVLSGDNSYLYICPQNNKNY